MAAIRLRVNGCEHRLGVPPGEPPGTVPRTELFLTAAGYGSGEPGKLAPAAAVVERGRLRP
ncbi:hypothetical protein D3C83_45020 [compost metagenome]